MKKKLKKALGIYLPLIIIAFITAAPVIWSIITSFKMPEDVFKLPVRYIPAPATFSNYIISWTRNKFSMYFFNSLAIGLGAVIFIVVFSMLNGYALSRFKFKGNGLIRNLFLFAALLPGIAMQVPVYQIMYTLGWINSLPGYIILMCGTDVISIYIFIQFFENIPTSLDESAIMDGCTYFGVFFRILLPLLKPAIITVMILKGVGTYNEYYMANLYLQDQNSLVTVATSLYKFTGPIGNQYNYICAGVLITMIPALIIFILCQKQIYSGLTQGAVKG